MQGFNLIILSFLPFPGVEILIGLFQIFSILLNFSVANFSNVFGCTNDFKFVVESAP